MEDLKKKAEELGIKVDGRWSEDRLREEIESVEAEAETARLAAEAEAQAQADAEAERLRLEQEEAERVAAEARAKEEAEAQAVREAEDAEVRAEAESQGDIEVINLKANPMRSLGLAGYGRAVIPAAQLAGDPTLKRRIDRGVELGLLKVE